MKLLAIRDFDEKHYKVTKRNGTIGLIPKDLETEHGKEYDRKFKTYAWVKPFIYEVQTVSDKELKETDRLKLYRDYGKYVRNSNGSLINLAKDMK